jgi:hypothetical protein
VTVRRRSTGMGTGMQQARLARDASAMRTTNFRRGKRQTDPITTMAMNVMGTTASVRRTRLTPDASRRRQLRAARPPVVHCHRRFRDHQDLRCSRSHRFIRRFHQTGSFRSHRFIRRFHQTGSFRSLRSIAHLRASRPGSLGTRRLPRCHEQAPRRSASVWWGSDCVCPEPSYCFSRRSNEGASQARCN